MNKKEIRDFVLAGLLIAIVGGGVWYYQIDRQPAEGVTAEENGFIIGDGNAPVTVVEYTNFLCSHCADFANDILPKLEEKYAKAGLVRFNIIVLPPVELGEASFCALDQGKFEDYHDYLFKHQSEIENVDTLIKFAREVGMNEEIFDGCLEANKHGDIINGWIKTANKRAVDSTPTFFISATDRPEKSDKIVGTQPLEEFERVVQKYLPIP